MKTYPLVETESVKLLELVYFGDPCYVFPDKEWQELCNLMFVDGVADFDDTNNIRVVELETGEKAYLFGTHSGDGEYPLKVNDRLTCHLGVDAGMLSLIPISFIQRLTDDNEYAHLGVILDVNTDGNMSVVDGNFKYGDFGKYNIRTDYYFDDMN